LQRQAFEQALVLGVEVAGKLVQHLGDADHLALLVADRHAQDVARAIARLAIDVLVEPGVGVGIADDFGFAAGEYRAGDAHVVGKADFANGVALQHAREQLAGIWVVEEQRAAVGVQCLGDDFHQAREEHVEREAVVDPVGDVGQRRGPPQHFGDAVEKFGLAAFVEAVEQTLDVILVQTMLEDLADGFEADLHARRERKACGYWIQLL